MYVSVEILRSAVAYSAWQLNEAAKRLPSDVAAIVTEEVIRAQLARPAIGEVRMETNFLALLLGSLRSDKDDAFIHMRWTVVRLIFSLEGVSDIRRNQLRLTVLKHAKIGGWPEIDWRREAEIVRKEAERFNDRSTLLDVSRLLSTIRVSARYL